MMVMIMTTTMTTTMMMMVMMMMMMMMMTMMTMRSGEQPYHQVLQLCFSGVLSHVLGESSGPRQTD